MTTIVDIARRLAEQHHAGQVDKAGEPYLGHVLRVADRVAAHGPVAVAAALLHDVIEDTAAGTDDLAAAGIPDAVIEVVLLLTKTEGPLDAYYARIRAHPVAVVVKLADVADNSDPARLGLLDAATRERLERKYAKAVAALNGE